MAIGSLAGFLASAGLDVKGASPDEQIANETNVRHVTCDNRPNNPVILIKEGDVTEINKAGLFGNCYVMQVSQCEILEAIEKFQVQSIIDAKGRQGVE